MSSYEESLRALDRAIDAIEAAEYDLAGNHILAATNRAYYAYFYCMTALLLVQNVHSKTHQGVHTKFSELYIKPGIFSPSIAISIKNAFTLRQEADYDLDADIPIEVARQAIEEAKTFYDLCRDHLMRANR